MDIVGEALIVSLLSTAAAEFGDKTQLGLVMLAASLRKPRAIFLGMITGFAFIAGAGVVAGQALETIIPLSVVRLMSGFIFVVVGLVMLRVDVEAGVATKRLGNSPFQATFLMIILTELGDKTQILTIALAARFAQPAAVFSGVMLAFALVDGLSIMLAGSLGKRLPTGKVKKVAAIIFVAIGILTLLGIL